MDEVIARSVDMNMMINPIISYDNDVTYVRHMLKALVEDVITQIQYVFQEKETVTTTLVLQEFFAFTAKQDPELSTMISSVE